MTAHTQRSHLKEGGTFSVANADLQIRGRGGGRPGHPDPEIRGGGGWPVSKKFTSVLRASVSSKNKGGPSPGSTTAFFRLLVQKG